MVGVQQYLVRFQDVTHVIVPYSPKEEELADLSGCDPKPNEAIHTYVLNQISQRTEWPVNFLRLMPPRPSKEQTPASTVLFFQVRVASQILGGKGGFGALLKGQAKQAGAKSTTDFSLCRDLQGRRLQDVNDSLARQQFQEWNRKVQAGTATIDQMAEALMKTDSGIPGWYLQTPNWGTGITKQQRRVWKRQLVNFHREQRAKIERENESRKRKQAQVDHYTSTVDQATQKISSSIARALQEGLKRQKQQDLPDAILSLAGDITLQQTKEYNWRVQSTSNFGTVAIMLRERVPAFYFEVKLITGGLAQIGWICPGFQPNSDEGDGVGDDSFSYSYDGSRKIKLHHETTETYGLSWKEGSVVGCLYNNGVLSFSLDGRALGEAFRVKPTRILFPAISLNGEEIVDIRVREEQLEHLPLGIHPIASILATSTSAGIPVEEEDDYDDDDDSQNNKPNKDTEVSLKSTPNSKSTPGAEISAIIEKDPAAQPISMQKPQPLDLGSFDTVKDLEDLGLDRLKSALMALGVKCGGTLEQRAERLFSLKGLNKEDFPRKLLAKR